MMAPGGGVQPHWQSFFDAFTGLGNDEVTGRSQEIFRFLKENGVTYNIYNDPDGLNRPWNLDPVPFIIGSDEWQTIETGLTQRAELFNLILKDIYGAQQIIKNGLLPPELIWSHKGFLRQCTGIDLPGKHALTLYSADMARSPDGRIWVLNDRTQAPSGSGYALENRMAMARILPELFGGLKVRRLSPYFNTLRSALLELSPTGKAEPRIVVLTPGPGNETYFEHSYLSSYLGFTLVQGDDLMVKDKCVWLKTLGGLEKVDVILRRLDDVFCDPLELKQSSQLGVSGLLQAVRAGNVSIANPLGSSILENPGLLPFLNGIAKYFLNEELVMPTIATWWCGQPKALQFVLENIDRLVIKRIYRESVAGGTSVDGSMLDSLKKEELKRRIIANPQWFVGQERVNFSSVPCFINDSLQPRNTLFRSFVVSSGGSYHVMNGGLTRTSAEAGNHIISNQLGGASKDTWVLAKETGERPVIHLEQEHVYNHYGAQHTGELPSHTAENLFWVGRYVERVLGNARFQRTVLQFLMEANKAWLESDSGVEASMLVALTNYTFTYPGFTDYNSPVWQDNWKEIRDVLFNAQRPGSLTYNFNLFNGAVYAVRDHWSADTWRVLKGMEEDWNATAATPGINHHHLLHALDSLIASLVAFIGLNRESISRDQGWMVLDTGRKIEQTLLLITMLRSTLVYIPDENTAYIQQESVLKSNECLVNYRYKYRAHLQQSLVLELMLLDPNNPRSLLYLMERLKNYMSKLPRQQAGHALSEHERLILEAYTLLYLADADKLCAVDAHGGHYKELDDFLSKLYDLMQAIPNVISKTYFKHALTQRQLFRVDEI